MVYVVPLVCFTVPLIMGFVLLRRGIWWIVPICWIAGAGAIYWALITGRQYQGWDGIGYAIFAILMVAPAVLGVTVGGLIGWLRARRARA